MDDVTTATGDTVPGKALVQLLVSSDWTEGVRGVAHATVSDRAEIAYASAYVLSGGGELHSTRTRTRPPSATPSPN